MRLLHVSDVHIGTRSDPAVERALAELIERVGPELLVVSGDLTHRGRREQHEAAAAFLRGLGLPLHVVPGNHDIPWYFTPARYYAPFRIHEEVWGETQPVYASAGLHIVGLNSVRNWRQQSGAVGSRQLRWAAEQLAAAAPGALRVVTLHHHLVGAPWRSRKKPVARRNEVLAALVDAGAELILAGHIHQAAVSERHEFELSTASGTRAVVVSIAPGLGQPRPNRRGEARGLHLYEARDDQLLVRTYIWRDDGWALTGLRRFPRGREPLAFEPWA